MRDYREHTDNAVIRFSDAVICNRENPVIHGLDMVVSPGDFVYITGKVGSGKTSLVRTIMAENPLAGGEGTVCGFNLKTIKSREIPLLRRRMGVVFQDFQLLMEYSVYDNLLFVLKCTGWKDRAAMDGRIDEVLTSVGMETKSHRMPFQLSGGEQQRVAVARALLNTPRLIMADEPTGNLDEDTASGIMDLMCKINREHGTAVIMVTHNNSIVRKYPGRIFQCEGERCIETNAIF